MHHSSKNRSVSIVPFLIGALLLIGSLMAFIIWKETSQSKSTSASVTSSRTYTNATLIEDENGKLIQLDALQFLTVTARPGTKQSSFLPPGVYRVTSPSTSDQGHGWRLVPALTAKDQAHITVDDNTLAREKNISVITVTRTTSPLYKQKENEWNTGKKN